MGCNGKESTVLIVDDDPTTVRLLRSFLQSSGLSTRDVGTLGAADCALRELDPALVLLDVHLSDGSGLEFCRSMRRNQSFAHTPVLFISSDQDEATKLQAFDSGGVDYITKPLARGETVARVRTHLRLREAYDRLAELQAERISRLADAQQLLMPALTVRQTARCEVVLKQRLSAGGDFYDIVPLDALTTDYIIADACGHDLSTSLWTAALKSLLTEFVSPLHDPLEIMGLLNASLTRVLPPGNFFTMVYARLNRGTGRLRLVNAGHTAVLLLRAPAGNLEVLEAPGDVLGAWGDALFSAHEVNLKPGDRLFLFTDGLLDPRGGGFTSVDQLGHALRDWFPLTLSEQVHAALHEQPGEITTPDDQLLIGIEV